VDRLTIDSSGLATFTAGQSHCQTLCQTHCQTHCSPIVASVIEKKRNDYTFQRTFNEQPSVVPG